MGSPDSWDAFDAKMFKTKKGPVKKDVHNQFLELSSSQNKSLNVADEDFSALSFYDAKNLIDKDENERLQFMNSNVSFSAGIDQEEAPSLLSVTNYFQQGSSFPVPYVGNDSTMFGDSRSGFLPSTLNETSQSQSQRERERRWSSSSSRNQGRSRHGRSSRTSSKDKGSAPVAEKPDEVTNHGTSRKTDLSRNDSLAKFFLGSQSDGLNKMDIMDYVLDYCKRRSSLRLSDASDIGNSFNNSSKHSMPERNDSGIGIGSDDKITATRKNNLSSGSDRDKQIKERSSEKENSSFNKSNSRHQGNHPMIGTDTVDGEESILITNGASIKDKEALDVSDVGSIDGFEKFKKNLHIRGKMREDRFRGKIKHHEEFEKKRLNVDERYSHPRLSPVAFKGSGSTATMERPNKKVPCSRERDVLDTVKQSTPREDLSVMPVSIVHPSAQQTQCSNDVSSQVLKQSNNPLEGLSMVPVIQSAMQQQQQATGNQTCACHHCGHQQGPSGLIPNGGLPIVIHIHLPCGVPSGTVAHPVPTNSCENNQQKM